MTPGSDWRIVTYPRVDDRIVVLLGGDRKQQVLRLCAERRITVSDFVRHLVDLELSRRNHPSRGVG